MSGGVSSIGPTAKSTSPSRNRASPALPVTLCRRTSTCGYSCVNFATNGGSKYWIVEPPAAMFTVPRSAESRSDAKSLVKLIDRLDQWAGQLKQTLAVVRELDARATTREELRAEFALPTP